MSRRGRVTYIFKCLCIIVVVFFSFVWFVEAKEDLRPNLTPLQQSGFSSMCFSSGVWAIGGDGDLGGVTDFIVNGGEITGTGWFVLSDGSVEPYTDHRYNWNATQKEWDGGSIVHSTNTSRSTQKIKELEGTDYLVVSFFWFHPRQHILRKIFALPCEP